LNEEQNKGGVENIINNKVTANAGRGIDIVGVTREQVADIAQLENEENDPAR
jgi:hypothetical protein